MNFLPVALVKLNKLTNKPCYAKAHQSSGKLGVFSIVRYDTHEIYDNELGSYKTKDVIYIIVGGNQWYIPKEFYEEVPRYPGHLNLIS